jgi:hypothetical protein
MQVKESNSSNSINLRIKITQDKNINQRIQMVQDKSINLEKLL